MKTATLNWMIGRTATGLCALLVSATVSAAFIPISQPDPSYLSATSRMDFAAPDFDVVPSLTDGIQTVTFDIGLVALSVPTTWSTWGSPPDTESATPRVLWTNGLTDLTLDLLAPALTFGFEAQPNAVVPFDITADFFSLGNLIGSITLNVSGSAGALLFAATSTPDPFDRIVVSSTGDFAIANVRYGLQAVPEPGSIALLIAGALGGGWVIGLRRRPRGEPLSICSVGTRRATDA